MATSKEQIQMIEAELQAIREQITRLKAQEEVLLKVQRSMSGLPEAAQRKRAPSVKPLVLDIMSAVGEAGATSQEVDAQVRATNPAVAKDTLGSVLTRLKSEASLVYVGVRSYEKRSAPQYAPFDPGLRVVN